ncbi:MAG: penicillin-binding protein 1C, partial [Synergistaceae bacterium]|nr:penicillin-binding protein 1C [Synergistaceae bacterium]
PLDLRRVRDIDGSTALYDNEGRLFHLRLSPASEWQIPIPLSEMGRWLPLVAVGAEDGRFYRHPGVDPLALLRAAAQLVSSGHVVSGASTLTTQLIRLSISEPEGWKRNLATKAREFVLALKLERHIYKEEILEGYLNRAPFGGNLRGVQAASLVYFGKPAAKLSPGEACLLIGMLKGPTLYRPDTRPQAAKARRDAVIRLMERKGLFDKATARRALLEELPGRKFSPPMRAWHFAELALQRGEGARSLKTSLNLETQTTLESILKQASRELPRDITLAAGVVENRTARLVAWVGNARFEEWGAVAAADKSRWVDCGRAPRSPGSTLKPFAYLSAIEQGLITPSSLLADTPLSFSGRAPRNFDLQYHGAVTARVALSSSLNAPAARVLRMAGPDNVLSLLREAGFKHLTKPAFYYGDSLILGGCEVTLLEELEGFTALASLGTHRELSLGAEGTPPRAGTRVASEAGCWMVCDILDHRGPLTLLPRGTLGGRWRAALKTGTSYGLRDAWAAAWTPDYTTVVWAGNPEGSSWPGLIGAQAAAPVAMRILRAVSPHSGDFPRPGPGTEPALKLRPVCTLSGQPPTAACPGTRMDWAIEGVTRTVPCSLHTIRQGRSAVLWPAEMGRPEGGAGVALRKRSPLTISSPPAGATYLSAPFAPQRIPMRAEGAEGRVWWYLDGRYLGMAEPGETFFHALPDGEHSLSVADEAGRSASVRVKVRTPGKRRDAPPRL